MLEMSAKILNTNDWETYHDLQESFHDETAFV